MAFVDDEVWTQQHICRVCGAKWECGYRLCWEPYKSKCGDCKCGPFAELCGWVPPLELKP
jgi:hypothetical protein